MPIPTLISIDHLPQSPLGPVWIALSANGLWALDYQVNREEFILISQDRGRVILREEPIDTQSSLGQVNKYLAGQIKDFSLQIDWSGMTEFQIITRKAVMDIPSGETISYGEIATKIGRPRAARAVGLVNATNPIPLVIPCHRVVGANGDLTGYGGAGGIKTKQWLLDLERGI